MEYNLKTLLQILDEKHLSWSITPIIENILDRVENPNDDEDILTSLDDELIYYDDQWIVLQEYQSPQEANWNEAIEQFICDLFSIVALLQKE